MKSSSSRPAGAGTNRLASVQPKRSKMTFGRVTSHWKLRENTMRTKARSRALPRGHWEENKAPWYEQTMSYCDACGMLIPKKQFVVEENGVRRRFCGAECAQIAERVRGLNKQ